MKLGSEVFGDKNNLRRPADELVLLRVRLGADKSKDGTAVWRGDGYLAVPGLKLGIKGQVESKLI